MSKARTFALLSAFLLTPMLATPSLARPRLVATGNCMCVCNVGGYWHGLIYPPIGGVCSGYDGKTCNVTDPATGGVRSGRLLGCDPEMTVQYVFRPQTLQPLTPYRRPGVRVCCPSFLFG